MDRIYLKKNLNLPENEKADVNSTGLNCIQKSSAQIDCILTEYQKYFLKRIKFWGFLYTRLN